jgi:diguanylate cyclase (GGDEF)-like protein/PAS domain S-box-containing protein
MTLPDGEGNPLPDSGDADWLAILQGIFLLGKAPAAWPASSARNDAWRKLAEDWLVIRQFMNQLTLGDLSAEMRIKGQLAGSLKSFQANLRHLTWQVQRVAAGDLTQKVDFMGDFSSAFNQMIANLGKARSELLASEERYRLLAENAADVIWTMDLNGKFTYISPSVQRLRGFTVEEAMAQTIEESLAPASAQLVRQKMVDFFNALQTGAPAENQIYELEQPHKNGGTIWIEVTTNAITSPEGKVIGFQGASRDITERRRAQQAERDQRNLAEALRDTVAALNSAKNLDEVFACLLENISRVVPYDTVDIFLTDPKGVAHIKASQGYEDILGTKRRLHTVKLQVNKIPNLRQMAETRLPCLVNDLEQFDWVQTGNTAWAKSHLGAPILVKEKTGGFFVLLSRQKDFFTPEQAGRLQSFADQAAIAIEKARLFEQLNELATTDALTEITNRRQFFNLADVEVIRARRYERPLSALMLDIDHFKQINDTYGHTVGDQVLQKVAERCQRVMRKNDLLGRYGGEEFVVLLPETPLPEAQLLAERLRVVIGDKPYETLRGNVKLSVSIGGAGFHAGILSARALLDRADQALYQAKQAGRNCVVTLE